jgi:hypothetical protein
MSELNLTPGQPLTNSEREALARDNEKETMEAQQMARAQMDEDIRNGKRPVVAEVADSLKQQMVDRFGEDGKKDL